MNIGNYETIRELGAGASGRVYLGRHRFLKKPDVAIKLLTAGIFPVEMFQQEAQTLSDLSHTNIVSVIDFGMEGTTPYIVMEYGGEGLHKRHPLGTKLPYQLIVSFVLQIATGLQYAHDRGVIHRDVKPENLFVAPNQVVKVGDFGIATPTPSLRTHQPGFAGSVHYMAPEQINLDPQRASDQYALGVVVYSWFAGVLPFLGRVHEVVAKQLNAMPVPLTHFDIPQIISDIIDRMLAKKPEDRFATIIESAQSLEQAVEQHYALTLYSVPPPQPEQSVFMLVQRVENREEVAASYASPFGWGFQKIYDAQPYFPIRKLDNSRYSQSSGSWSDNNHYHVRSFAHNCRYLLPHNLSMDFIFQVEVTLKDVQRRRHRELLGGAYVTKCGIFVADAIEEFTIPYQGRPIHEFCIVHFDEVAYFGSENPRSTFLSTDLTDNFYARGYYVDEVPGEHDNMVVGKFGQHNILTIVRIGNKLYRYCNLTHCSDKNGAFLTLPPNSSLRVGIVMHGSGGVVFAHSRLWISEG